MFFVAITEVLTTLDETMSFLAENAYSCHNEKSFFYSQGIIRSCVGFNFPEGKYWFNYLF